MSNRTQKNAGDALKFIESIGIEQRKKDCTTLLPIFEKITGEKPVMWGDGIIGFGEYTYNYKSGGRGVWLKTGFSPRKHNITLYVTEPDPMTDADKKSFDLLGRYKTGRSCLYIKKLDDVDMKVLKEIIQSSYKSISKKYD